MSRDAAVTRNVTLLCGCRFCGCRPSATSGRGGNSSTLRWLGVGRSTFSPLTLTTLALVHVRGTPSPLLECPAVGCALPLCSLSLQPSAKPPLLGAPWHYAAPEHPPSLLLLYS